MTDDEAEPADVDAPDGPDDDDGIEDGPTDDAADVADEEEQASDGLENGDFVRLEYTVRTAEDGQVVDTTSEEVAADAGIDEEDHDFSPRVVVVGAGHVFRSVDEDLAGRAVGDENTVTVPATEAFGEFDPDQVRTVSAEKIPEDDRYPGAQVQIDGEQGYVETIIGGRARVDFNHPLAGQDLEYEYEIVDVVEDRSEKARGLLGMYLRDVPEVRIETDEVEEEVEIESEGEDDEDAEPETEVRTVEKETLYIEATPTMAMNQQWLFQKQQVAQQLMTRLDLDRVIVEEVLEGMGGGGGLGGMMGGLGGGGDVDAGDLEAAIDEVDLDDEVDAEEIVEELDATDE
ncbi:MAG: peptidylprolyl isomerase [Haloferacaceae archaeon]